jgi:hypothetical protein
VNDSNWSVKVNSQGGETVEPTRIILDAAGKKVPAHQLKTQNVCDSSKSFSFRAAGAQNSCTQQQQAAAGFERRGTQNPTAVARQPKQRSAQRGSFCPHRPLRLAIWSCQRYQRQHTPVIRRLPAVLIRFRHHGGYRRGQHHSQAARSEGQSTWEAGAALGIGN